MHDTITSDGSNEVFMKKCSFTQDVTGKIAGMGAAVLLAMGAVPAQADHGVMSVENGVGGCFDLLAGKTIDAGDVCFAVSGDRLNVTYNTEGDWRLSEVHLWSGDVEDAYPMARNGNPKIGNFPYSSGDISGSSSYSFSLPLGSIQSFFDVSNLDAHCGESNTIYAMAHAAVERVDGSGNVLQSETGWSDGEGAVEKGSWATRTSINLGVSCDSTPPPPPTLGQETAIMKANIVLNDETDGYCRIVNSDGTVTDAFAAERWGWQAGPLGEGQHAFEVWAAAGRNDTSKGTLVGYVDINITSGNVSVTPVLYEGFSAEETHIYIGTEAACSGAFGRDWDELASTDLNTGNGVYVAVHFSIAAGCQENGNFCDNQ